MSDGPIIPDASKRGRPRLDEDHGDFLREMLSSRFGWIDRTIEHMSLPRDRADATRVLDELTSESMRKEAAEALLSFVVPVMPDVETWALWAAGFTAPSREEWVKKDAPGGKFRGQRELTRLTQSAHRYDAKAREDREKAEAFLESAAVAEAAAARARDQGRAFVIMLMDTALQGIISPAYSMGAGWVVLRAIAGTGSGPTMLAKLDKFGRDPQFVKAFGQCMLSFIDAWVEPSVDDHIRRYGVASQDHKEALPDGVDAAVVRSILDVLFEPVQRPSSVMIDPVVHQVRASLRDENRTLDGGVRHRSSGENGTTDNDMHDDLRANGVDDSGGDARTFGSPESGRYGGSASHDDGYYDPDESDSIPI